MNCYADLHIHTTNSDGLLTPDECIDKAVKANVKVISFTDHDSVEAYKHVSHINREISIISGVEITVTDRLHILGYFINLENSILQKELEKMRIRKAKWLFNLVDYYGPKFGISLNKILSKYGNITMGSICSSLIEATNGKLDKKDIYNQYFWNKEGKNVLGKIPSFTEQEAINLIKTAEGIAVLAHPALVWENNKNFEEILAQLIANGLDGMEIFHILNERRDKIPYLIKLAESKNLIITGGSDFHGNKNKNTYIGEYGLDKDLYKRFEKTKKDNWEV